ncbi:MAG: hypothetical protein ABSB73_12885 [Solirubrobacteraceae bacterium]|jgi:preprotein translocase subunit SecG
MTPHDAAPPQPPRPPAPESAEGWYEEPDELPPRPRARFLTPLTVVLMLILFAACGFIGGVLVQKNQQSGSTSVLGAASSRFGVGATGASGAAGAGGGFSRFASLFGGGAAGSGETIGTVTDISGNKLYVTSAAGTMTEVITTPESKITKSESVGAKAIEPGDSVVATGVTGASGALTASTVSDSGHSAASAAGGLASLFGGGTGTGATSTSGSAGLFGGGG